MTQPLHQFEAIESHAQQTLVTMLDALLDASMAAQGGFSAARYASDLRRLGDNLAVAADEIGQIFTELSKAEQAVAAA